MNQNDTIKQMQEAAIAFLQSLQAGQKAKAELDFSDTTERENWHYIPRLRAGLPLKEMDPSQRLLARGLVKTGLSDSAYEKVCAIIELEPILASIEGQGRKFTRDPELYFVTVFGDPATELLWGWRFEGHHVSLNFTIINGQHIGTAPIFLGANPAHVRHGEKSGFRALKEEEDLGRQLVSSFDKEQQTKAVLMGEAPADILTRNLPHVEGGLKPEGLSAAEMTPVQQEVLVALVQTYVRRLPEPLAQLEIERVLPSATAGCFFVWAGPRKVGAPHYYRIQGNNFLAEYDNTQNCANHIHAVWRNLQNDFALDFLRKHYQQEHR